MNYKKTQIYQVHNLDGDIVVYGYTTQNLSKKLASLRSQYKQFLMTPEEVNYKPEFAIFKICEKDDVKISLVENFPCKSHNEASERVEWYLTNFINENYNIDEIDDIDDIIEEQNDILGFQDDGYDGDVNALFEKMKSDDPSVSLPALRRWKSEMY